mgnify:CR=1 FL=1
MKKKKIAAVILAVMIGITAFSGCGTKENKSPADTSGTGSSVEAQENTGKERVPVQRCWKMECILSMWNCRAAAAVLR